MSETLIGVIIGGIIASIAPVFTLIIDHRRWRRESKLAYLLSERKNLETLYAKNLKRFSKAIAENSFSSDMISDFLLSMPKDVSKTFKAFMADPEKTEKKCKQFYMNLAVEMQKSLSEIDSKIETIVS
jgi:Tfp pilus assembly protein PilE